MPFYVSATNSTADWCNQTTSTTGGSYLNPFFGATGGSGTCSTTSTTTWVVGSVVLDEWGQGALDLQSQMLYRQAQDDRTRYYQAMIDAQMEAERRREAAMTEEQRAERRARQELERAARAERAARFAAEQAAALAAAQAAAEARYKAAKEAEKRAEELLWSKLTPEQRKTFEENKWFIVEGGKTKTKYRIRTTGYAGNIRIVNSKGVETHQWCVHAASSVPLYDHLLSQMAMLQWDEDAITKVANKSRLAA